MNEKNKYKQIMKKIVVVYGILIALFAMTSCKNDNADNIADDSIIGNTKSLVNVPEKARYKMLPTENVNIHLKLDTKCGRIWMVQYRLGDQPAMELSIDHFSAISENEGWNGRFDIYPTFNVYKFLMLDTETGKVYQAQWHIDVDKRFVEEIY